MKRLIASVGLIFMGLCVAATSPLVAEIADPHAYFNALVARSDHWKSYSLRTQAQLDTYAVSSKWPASVTYDPAHDADLHRQDAAKVVIPAFTPLVSGQLGADCSSSSSVITLASINSNFYAGRAILIDTEAMHITAADVDARTVTVSRGFARTTAVAHRAGANVFLNSNSLLNQVRVPLGTSDGNTYLFTWDAYWTDSYLRWLPAEHKAFQLSSGGDSIWLETQTRFDGGYSDGFDPDTDVASVTLRSYNVLGGTSEYSSSTPEHLGPGVTKNDPVLPMTGQFKIKANTWTRFWIKIEQRAGDYDYVDYWVADERTGPVQLYRHLPVSVREGGSVPSSIAAFWLEFNTSTSRFYRGNTRDVVAYVRNFVALRNPSDTTGLLLRPLASVSGLPTATSVTAPANVRIIR